MKTCLQHDMAWVKALRYFAEGRSQEIIFGQTIVLLRTNAGRYTLPYFRSSRIPDPFLNLITISLEF